MDDLISRQDAIEAVQNRHMMLNKEKVLLINDLEKLPSAEPKKRGMSIEQEKMIVESLPSLYPMQKFEEDAIKVVLDALPHWIPCSDGLPKEEGFYLVTLEDKCGAETTIRFFRIENGERQWSLWGNENITAWMPKPEPYKGVTE